MRLLLFLVFYCFAPEIFAGVFDVIPTDKSKEYLGIIFGGSVGAVSLGGGGNPMLSLMFERFNIIIVTAGVIILSYVGIVSAVNTAREGEAMGKKFSLWVPLRGLFGMSLMVPSPGTGYSLVQMTVIWIVLNGIGAANAVWDVVLDQMARGIKAVGTIDVPIDMGTLGLRAQQVLQSAICMYKINSLGLDITKNYGPIGLHYLPFDQPILAGSQSNPDAIFQTAHLRIGVSPDGIGGSKPSYELQNICGTVDISTSVYKNDSNSGDAFNKASVNQRLQIKVNAYLAMFDALAPTANAIANCAPDDSNCVGALNPGYISAAANAYKAQIVQLAGGVRSAAIPGGAGGGFASFSMSAPSGAGIQAAAGGKPTGTNVGKDIKSSAAYVKPGAQAGYQGAVSAGQGSVAFAKESWEREPAPVAITREQTQKLKAFGWIHAGSYYYALSKQTSTGLNGDALGIASIYGYPISIAVDFNSPTPPQGWKEQLYVQLINAGNRISFNTALSNGTAAGSRDLTFVAGTLPALGSGKASTGNEFMDQVVNAFSSGLRDPIVKFFQEEITGKTEDPLVSMGRFGWKLMMAGEALIFYMIAMSALIMVGISPGSCLNPLPWSGQTLFSQLFLLLFGVTIMLWGAGATLGVYLPLVPYIVFTVTALGWMVAVIEAVVGAPLIALSLIQPSGEELGNIKAALGILATVFLKPVLMIFGFILAGSLMRAGLAMLNFGFVKAIDESVLPTIFNVVVTLFMLVFVDTMFVNKAFELIHILPNKVLRFMGLSPEAGGEEGMIKEAKGGFDTGSGAAHKAIKGAYEDAGKKLGDQDAKGGTKGWSRPLGGGGGGQLPGGGAAPAGGAPPGGGAAPAGGAPAGGAPAGGAPAVQPPPPPPPPPPEGRPRR